ncbi:MAG: protein-L-isoaspartate O-methyltransferase [Rhodobacteraceae bacterium]|nr:protein-L-isoaspartate O-methyltransferase [Paracoccaceae bacterium]
MSDFASQRTTMVDTQVRPSDVTSFPIIEAMLHVPREAFVPDAQRSAAYAGEALPLAPGRVIADPRVLAKMLEELDVGPDDLVLDIGAGLGYSSAVIARMAQAVVALEDDEARSADAAAALAALGADNVAVTTGPLTEGAAQHGPYDAIILQGAVEDQPKAIADQLKDGGKIVAIFNEGTLGVCRLGLKSGDQISWRRAFDATAPVLPGFSSQPEFAL